MTHEALYEIHVAGEELVGSISICNRTDKFSSCTYMIKCKNRTKKLILQPEMFYALSNFLTL